MCSKEQCRHNKIRQSCEWISSYNYSNEYCTTNSYVCISGYCFKQTRQDLKTRPDLTSALNGWIQFTRHSGWILRIAECATLDRVKCRICVHPWLLREDAHLFLGIMSCSILPNMICPFYLLKFCDLTLAGNEWSQSCNNMCSSVHMIYFYGRKKDLNDPCFCDSIPVCYFIITVQWFTSLYMPKYILRHVL